ncbi:MAG: ribosome biogenesis GTPase YlqF [Gottschalkiaceae bacterium]|nr:MAG: ribosome biogenesis GTPase YlqF [Gottschalkiaceae bacterium]
MNIQWYPGHMAKARKKITEELKLVDIVIELLDARIPISSRNPDVDAIVGNKKRMIVLNKSDLADENINKQWKDYFSQKGIGAIFVNSLKGNGLRDVLTESKKLMKVDLERLRKKGILRKTVRALVIGIPNVGKSSFINRMANRSIAQTGDKPGVTKSKQWIKINEGFELLDTPGILWPKFDDEITAQNLAFTGAIKDEILDINELAKKFILKALDDFPDKFSNRYGIQIDKEYSIDEIISFIGKKRGCILTGGEIDINRVSYIIMDDFRSSKMGRISLESPVSMLEKGN